MDITAKQFIVFNFLVVTLIVISFFVGRKEKRPSRLNLNADLPPGQSASGASGASGAPSFHRDGHRKTDVIAAKALVVSDAAAPIAQEAGHAEQSLTVYFNWNGHMWEAYEVLGLPAGSSLEATRAAYERVLTQGDSDSTLFFKAAYEAIVTSQSKRS